MTKEAIDLLESIKVVPAEDDSEGNTCCKMKVSDYKKIFQSLALLKQQPPAGDEMTKKFNTKIEEIKSMFVVAQAMAKNSFDSTLQSMPPVEGETYNPDPPPVAKAHKE